MSLEVEQIQEFKLRIKDFQQSLNDTFNDKHNAPSLVKKRCAFVDLILIEIWNKHLNIDNEELSLIAVGGYGRFELHPHSDIDLFILYKTEVTDRLQSQIAAYIRCLWDIGLEPGYSTRNIQETIANAENDVSIMTNLLERRYICGNEGLYRDFSDQFDASNLWPTRRFIQEKLIEQNDRHYKFNDTEENLEPNIKNSPGGLRDIQTIYWIARRYSGSNDIKSLIKENIISTEEEESLQQCRNFLWKIRFGLHILRNRKEERLLFDYQQQLAASLGFGTGKQGIEKLMKKYYRVSKQVRLLNEILIHHIKELSTPKNSPKVQLSKHFITQDNYIEIKNKEIFKQYPETILEIFHLMQLNSDIEGIGANTLRLLRSNISIIDQEYRNNEKCKSLFIKILSHENGQTHALRRMNMYGVLAAYIPAFNRIVGQMQYDLFHIYTVDAHSLMVVRNLRRFCLEDHKDEYLDQYEVMLGVDNRMLLFLAGLLHDIGKGRDEDHSIVGERVTKSFMKRLGLHKDDIELVSWLVRQHLLMSHTAQSEDISNPHVLIKFAEKVLDIRRLNYLYLLTVADIMGTSPKLWTRWKGSLLLNLYNSTKALLNSDVIETKKLNKQIEAIKKQVIELAEKNNLKSIHYSKLWKLFNERYFLTFSPEVIYWHSTNILNEPIYNLPIAVCKYSAHLECNRLFIYTAEKDVLLSIISRALDHLEFSITNASIIRHNNGMTLCDFIIHPLLENNITSSKSLNLISDKVKEFICSNKNNLPKIKKRRITRKSKHFRIQDKVLFSQSDSQQYTVMTVITQDKPALLYLVSEALIECKVSLHGAKINTFGEKVEDYFFITDRDNNQIKDHERIEELKAFVLSKIAQS